MIVPFLLLLFCLCGLTYSFVINGFVLTDLVLLCAVAGGGAAVLLIRAVVQYMRRDNARYVVVDGSNVMFWRDEKPSLDTVRKVLDVLIARGLVPVVWFDANVGYKVGDRYLGPKALARQLKLGSRQVFVAPKGTRADGLLLERAGVLAAKVVSNDRFSDWFDGHPEKTPAGFLVHGHLRGGEVVLEHVSKQGDPPVAVSVTPGRGDLAVSTPSKGRARRQRRATREMAKALSPRRWFWAIASLPLVATLVAFSVYIRTSPYEPSQAVLHLAAMSGCNTARKIGLAPAYLGELGYHARNDTDGDGVACEAVVARDLLPGRAASNPVSTEESKTRRVGGAKFVKP